MKVIETFDRQAQRRQVDPLHGVDKVENIETGGTKPAAGAVPGARFPGCCGAEKMDGGLTAPGDRSSLPVRENQMGIDRGFWQMVSQGLGDAQRSSCPRIVAISNQTHSDRT